MYVECFQKSWEVRRNLNTCNCKFEKEKKSLKTFLKLGIGLTPDHHHLDFFLGGKKYHREIFTVVQPWNFSEKRIKNSVGRGHCHIATGDFDTLWWVIKTWYQFWPYWSYEMLTHNFFGDAHCKFLRPSAFLGAKSQLVKYVICVFHSFYVQMHIYELCSS